MNRAQVRLKKNEDQRIRFGHPWIYSNEINTTLSPLKKFTAGEEVEVLTHDQKSLGIGYINPQSLITIRMMSSDRANLLDVAFFSSRLLSAYQLRDRLFSEPYYRLIYAEADDLPGVIIDRFAQHLVMQINTAGMELKIDVIKQALLHIFPWIKSIYLRNDSAIRQQEGLALYSQNLYGITPATVQIKENTIPFLIPLITGQKTGWFYDHRYNRAQLKNYVRDKRVLDVFSYLGAWAIQAARFGAKTVECIEISPTAIDYISQNVRLNGVEEQISIIQADAFDALKQLVHNQHGYDVIILDPPAFIKKRKDRDQGLIAYYRLHEYAFQLLAADGVLISCSCSMHLPESDLISLAQRAANKLKTKLQILYRGFQGPDHPIHPLLPEAAYLKAVMFRKLR